MKITNVLVITMLALLLISGCDFGSKPNTQTAEPPATIPKATPPPQAPKPTPSGADGKVKVELWVMSECPYGTVAEGSLLKVRDALGAQMDLSVHFVLEFTSDGKLASMHGESELEKDMVQACVGVVAPGKMLDFIVAQNGGKDPWRKVAAGMGLDVGAIEKCLADGTGQGLLMADAKQGKQRGIDASPMVFFNGEEYKGMRSSRQMFDTICKALGQGGSAVCAEPPATLSKTDALSMSGSCSGDGGSDKGIDKMVDNEFAFTHTVVFDPEAVSSSLDRILESTSLVFPKATIEKLESTSPKGRETIARYGITWLPAYLFPANITEASNYKPLSQVVVKTPKGDAYMLDPQQAGATVNLKRKRIPRQVMIYYTPFEKGVMKAILNLNSLKSKPEYEASGTSLKIVYIPRAQVNDKGEFPPDVVIPIVEELARQQAILEISTDKFFRYLQGRLANPMSSYWEDFVSHAGLEPELVKKIATSNRLLNLLRANSAEALTLMGTANSFGLLENREIFDFRDPNTAKKALAKLSR